MRRVTSQSYASDFNEESLYTDTRKIQLSICCSCKGNKKHDESANLHCQHGRVVFVYLLV